MNPAEPVCVALSGLHRGESPQPGGPVAESLRRRWPDLRVIGLCYDALESGIFSTGADRLDAAYLMPYPGSGPEPLLGRLREVIAREKVQAIIPCLDSELANYLALAEDLRRLGVRTLVPDATALTDSSKTVLPGLCKAVGVPAPRTFHAQDAATLAGYSAETGFPCYVKGRLYDARAVHNLAELYAAFADIFRVWGAPVLLQEAISGEEYDVAGLGDGKGGLIATCSIRKMLRTRLGKGYGGVVIANPEIDEMVRKIIGRLRWNGPFELEFIKAPGCPPALMEMNPRFPAWIDFPAKIGCNMPAAHLARILSLPAEPLAACAPGRMFMRHSTDLVGDIADVAALMEGQLAGDVPRHALAEAVS